MSGFLSDLAIDGGPGWVLNDAVWPRYTVHQWSNFCFCCFLRCIGMSTGLIVTADARGKSDDLKSKVSFRCPERVIRSPNTDIRLGTVEYNRFNVFRMDFR
jgi:hypothetical protein